MASNPLDKTFNLPTNDELDDMEYKIKINIPENPTLADVASLALAAYKQQMEELNLVEPKNRIKYLDTANYYLNTAKDALKSMEDLRIKENKTSGKKEPEDDEGRTLNRKELMDEVSKQRKKKISKN